MIPFSRCLLIFLFYLNNFVPIKELVSVPFVWHSIYALKTVEMWNVWTDDILNFDIKKDAGSTKLSASILPDWFKD